MDPEFQPDHPPPDHITPSAEGVFAKLAGFMPRRDRVRFLDWLINYVNHLKPADTLLRLLEGLGYLVLSVHNIPQKIEEQRLLLAAETRKTVATFRSVQVSMISTAGETEKRLKEATRELMEERKRHETLIEEKFKLLEEKLELRLADMPWRYAGTTLGVFTDWLREHSRLLLFCAVILFFVYGILAFCAGYYWAAYRH